MNSPSRALAIGTIALAAVLACPASWAQGTDSPNNPPGDSSADQTGVPAPDSTADSTADSGRHATLEHLLDDVESYYTAPLRWDGEQWALFGGAIGAVALAHHYDSDVRTHFVGAGASGSTSNSSLEDALPAAALWAGTYIYSTEWHDRSGLTVTWAMLEGAGLSTVTAYAFQYAIRRSGPDETTDPNQWFSSGSSFPSEHTTAAFAIGTVFAESGSGGYRWLTRVLGYGVASFTAYERLKHNAHWLSDVVAGAALGGSTGVFVLDRTYGGRSASSALSVVPTDGGLMLAYHQSLP